MRTNTCILGIRDGITGAWGFHRHEIQLPIITRSVNIGFLKVLILELNDCGHIDDLVVNESFTSKMTALKEQDTTQGV